MSLSEISRGTRASNRNDRRKHGRGEAGGRAASGDSEPVKLHLSQVCSPRGGHYGAGEDARLWETRRRTHMQREGRRERERPGSPEVSISPAVKEQSSLEAQSCRSARHSSLSPFRCTPVAAGALRSTSAQLQDEPGQTQPPSNYFPAQLVFLSSF